MYLVSHATMTQLMTLMGTQRKEENSKAPLPEGSPQLETKNAPTGFPLTKQIAMCVCVCVWCRTHCED